MESRTIAIVGSGLIGVAWACVFGRAGHKVRLYDTQETQLEAAKKSTLEKLQELEGQEELRGQKAEEVMQRISFTGDLKEAVEGAYYVQECTPEKLEIKQSVFKQLEAACDDADTILASSTSNIKPSLFAEGSPRVLVAHPVNPPFAIPVVELVPSPTTSTEVMERARQLLEGAGMRPAVLKREIEGFLVNRLQYALLAEAWRLVEAGIAEPEDVDAAVSHGLALRWSFMGPFQTISLNAPEGVADYCSRYDDGVRNVLSTQDNSTRWSQETIDLVDQRMQDEVPPERRAERTQWRNERLMALHKHKQSATQWQKK